MTFIKYTANLTLIYLKLAYIFVFLLQGDFRYPSIKANNLVFNSGIYLFKNANTSGNEIVKQIFKKN